MCGFLIEFANDFTENSIFTKSEQAVVLLLYKATVDEIVFT